MLIDRYGNALSTTSSAARDAYVDGVDRFLAMRGGVDAALDRALDADPGFALAHVAKARQAQMKGDRPTLTAHLAKARDTKGLSTREAEHVNALGLLLEGKGPQAYKAIREHVAENPRDAMIVQTCIGVFGLIGFSGQPGREAEQLAFTTALAPHYGDDWWFLGGHAFAQVEAGQTAAASLTVERSLDQRPENANAAHYKAHIHYEAGETKAGLDYIDEWRDRYYPKRDEGLLHCHVSWHIALWALEKGDIERMWAVIDSDIAPGRGLGPAINLLTDTAAILYRAQLAGVDVPDERWRDLSTFATRFFPKPGLAFADVHAALAHAMAGESEALDRIVTDAAGPAADVVAAVAVAFRAISAEEWTLAASSLAKAMSDHARIGGSRAQRDLLEYALLSVLLKQGQSEQARLLLQMRRPVKADAHAVAGL